MAKFRGAVLTCKECSKEFKVSPSRANTAVYCSKGCADLNRSDMMPKKRVSKVCPCCGVTFEVPECHIDRRKYCSNECRNRDQSYLAAQSERMSRDGNPMWNGGSTFHSNGYLYEFAHEHPFASNGYVFQHRLVMEAHLKSNHPDSPFLVMIGETLYLSPNYVVHHKDENKTNNAIENLECMTASDHRSHHANKLGRVIRCKTCGKAFYVKKCRLHKAKYCSIACLGKSKRNAF